MGDGGGIKIVSIENHDRTQYHEAEILRGIYNFGSEIDKNAQFKHQTRGPDGITYGCYGYLNDDGRLESKHYIADARGFRILSSTDPIEVFPITGESK